MNIILFGCCGRMGNAFTDIVAPPLEIVAGIDRQPDCRPIRPYPVLDRLETFGGHADMIVDFSHHSAISELTTYALHTATPLVIGTTGHTEQERRLIARAAKQIPIFQARNLSVGVNVLVALARRAAFALPDFDIEITERHHNQKIDAPSGTAQMLLEGLWDARPDLSPIYDRHTLGRRREPSEIGIHSVRGGSIIGDHEVLFAGVDECVSVSHTAASRSVFAYGAMRAALFLYEKPAALYSMEDLVDRLLL